MDSQNERLGSLMAFSDIGLILSTYGVLLAFNYLIEPVGINTWIVCTFFVGIKILVVGIADITGIGKSVVVSMLFVLIADAVIILINQLMAFGLSLRMLLVMTIVDAIVIMAAVLIWKAFAKKSSGTVANQGKNSWVYDDERPQATSQPTTTTTNSEIVNTLFQDGTQEQTSVPQELPVEETESVFGEHADDVFNTAFFTGSSNDEEQGGESFLSFDQITEELPSEDEIEAHLNAMGQSLYTEETPFTPAFETIETSTVTEPVKEVVTEDVNEPEITVEEPKTEEIQETAEQEEKPEVSEVIELPQTEEEVIEVEPEAEPVVQEETEEPVKEEIEETPVEVIEEDETEETSEPEVEEVEEPEIEEIEAEEIEETKEEASTGFTIPLESQETEKEQPKKFEVSGFGQQEETEEEVPEPTQPIGIINEDDFREITGTLPVLSEEFIPLSIDVTQNEVDEARAGTREALITLNTQLNQLIERYNQSLTPEQSDQYIENVEIISSDDSIQSSDRMIRNKLKDIIDKQFVQDDVLHNLISVINKISNRSYTLDVAEDNLKERERLEQARLAEEKRREEEKIRLQEEQRAYKAKLEAQRQEAERKRQEALKQEEQRVKEAEEAKKAALEKSRRQEEVTTGIITETETNEQPAEIPFTLEGNEIHLQNDELDIIIDAKDLELLKEFLKQQGN